MSDSLKFEIKFKKGNAIPKDPRVKAEEFVSVVKEAVNINGMEKKSPYKYFDMQFLRSSILEENALKMASEKYSNSDVANVMTNVSQESGKKAAKMGVFVKYTPELLGSDLEKDPDLVGLSKYWVSTMSRHKYASIRTKVKTPIIQDFCDDGANTKVIKLDKLNLYADYLAVPNSDTNITTSMTIDGQEFVNSRFIPGSFLDVMFQDDAIDDIYLPKTLLEGDYKSLDEYLTITGSKQYNIGKTGASGIAGAGVVGGLGAGGAAIAGAALAPVALGAAAVGFVAGAVVGGRRTKIPVVIRKRINITNEPENLDNVDIPLEEYLTNVTNIFIQYVTYLSAPPKEAEAEAEEPEQGANRGFLSTLVGFFLGDDDAEVFATVDSEETLFYALLNYKYNNINIQELALVDKKQIIENVLITIDSKLKIFDANVKKSLMDIYDAVKDAALAEGNQNPQAIITAANTAYPDAAAAVAAAVAGGQQPPVTPLIVPALGPNPAAGTPISEFILDAGDDDAELKRRIIFLCWHFKNVLFNAKSPGFVISGGINKNFKQPPPFTQELDFFIYSEFDPYNPQWKDATYSNTQLLSSLWSLATSLPGKVKYVWNKYITKAAQESVEEQNIKKFIDENKSTPFKYLIFRAKKIAVRPVPLSKTDIVHVDSLNFIEPVYSTAWIQANPGLFTKLLASTTLSGTGNRILLSFTRIGMMIKNFWTQDQDYNVNPAWLSLFYILSARNFSCPAYFETLLQSDIVEGRKQTDPQGAQQVLQTATASPLNVPKFLGIGVATPIVGGVGAGFAIPAALSWLGVAIGSGLLLPIGAGAAAAIGLATVIPERFYMSEYIYRNEGRGNNTMAGLLTVFFQHVKDNKSTFGVKGDVTDVNFIVTDKEMKIRTKKLENATTTQINKNDLVNFEMLPTLLPSAMKIFPTTYNKPLGDFLVQYDQNRAKFLDDKPWEKNKQQKTK